MTQQIQTYSISAPGFLGLNTQDSSLDLAQGYALIANNAVIDQYGRIGARKGWAKANTVSPAALGTASVQAIGQLVINNGSEYVVCAGNNKLFSLASSVLTELTYGGGGVAPVITASNWQIATLNQVLYFFQEGQDPLIFDPAVSTTTYRRVSEKAGYSGVVPLANIAISAFGRLWVASTTTNKTVVTFSDLLAGQTWTAGTSGTLDISEVWPAGSDTITGLAAHNNSLFIFGRNSILVYTNATEPASIVLSDTVSGIGCIARDSIQITGTDVIFLSSTGVRSVLRTIQEKSAPFRDLSKNVRNDLLNAVQGQDTSLIKSVYNPIESFYLLTFSLLQQVYCFDMKAPLQDGSARVTTWDKLQPTAFYFLRNRTMLIGQKGYVGIYSGNSDDGVSYRFQYFTNHSDLGDQAVTSILKRIQVIVVGGTSQSVIVKWAYDFSGNYLSQTVLIPAQGVAYYGIAEYNIANYSSGTNLQTLTAYPTGSGKIIQTGYEADINGSPLSIQKIELQAKNGKYV
jgi:hypothetical protein